MVWCVLYVFVSYYNTSYASSMEMMYNESWIWKAQIIFDIDCIIILI